jgi:hypothetical protein
VDTVHIAATIANARIASRLLDLPKRFFMDSPHDSAPDPKQVKQLCHQISLLARSPDEIMYKGGRHAIYFNLFSSTICHSNIISYYLHFRDHEVVGIAHPRQFGRANQSRRPVFRTPLCGMNHLRGGAGCTSRTTRDRSSTSDTFTSANPCLSPSGAANDK